MLQQIHSSFEYRGDERVTIRWMLQPCIVALFQDRVLFHFVFVFYNAYLLYIVCSVVVKALRY
jgi:hypothetical protein